MANSQNGITRANALAIAAELAHGAGRQDVAEVLEKMHEQLTKPRKATVSKARKLNEGLAVKLAVMLAPEGNTSKEIVGFGIPEVMSTQKAVAVMRVAMEKGLVRKVTEGKTIKFAPITE